MDPVSIATGVIAIVGEAIKTTNTAVRFCKGARSLNDDLTSLANELSSLQRSLNDVYGCLSTPATTRGIGDLERQSGCAVVSTIVQTMRNCESSAQQLHTCFAQAYPSKPGSDAPWFERGLKHSKLDHMQGEISRIRQQIQGYLIAMQLSFSILNL